jgi:hypothetical protein
MWLKLKTPFFLTDFYFYFFGLNREFQIIFLRPNLPISFKSTKKKGPNKNKKSNFISQNGQKLIFFFFFYFRYQLFKSISNILTILTIYFYYYI